MPQIAYYVYAYLRLMEAGEIQENEQINVVVPTGNFGNILAAYYAKEMGIPIARFICASNENKVLYDFFRTGCYDRNRDFRNFGNILAAYYAKEMGIPIARFICASNENKVLYDFFRTGCYDRNRDFRLTNSPSMDILISSNLERLIYKIAGNDAEKNRNFMEQLGAEGKYEITEEMKEKLREFYGNYANGEKP